MTDRGYRASYTGALYVRPVGRGIILDDHVDRPYLDDWVEQALSAAGMLGGEDAWLAGGRTTEPITLTITIEAAASQVDRRD